LIQLGFYFRLLDDYVSKVNMDAIALLSTIRRNIDDLNVTKAC
jgi:hypothetical protein